MTQTLENKVEKNSHGLTNLRMIKTFPLATPREIKNKYPLSEKSAETVKRYREEIQNVLDRKDPRMIIVAGPCSIHDTCSALEYANKIKEWNENYGDKFLFVMRAYFEKPRTQLGWKGFLLDPDLNETYDIEKGHSEARKLLLEINEKGVPCGTEFLGFLTPQYYDDLISWGAIGARTVESQPHREMVSGLSMPIGFKNNTEGNIKSAVNAIKSARGSHWFVGGDLDKEYVIFETSGNKYTHLILRGGNGKPNFDQEEISKTLLILKNEGITPENIMIDCSHDNSGKDYKKQPEVFDEIIKQRIDGNTNIIGIMLESNIHEGNQKIPQDLNFLRYGVSITDSCMGIETTEEILKKAYESLLIKD